ncbi:hypothetical protein LCGC14_2427460, partial [marine sediment metagenome]
MKFSDIIMDEEIYPRGRISQKTVDSYLDVMMGGVTFPPILIQKVLKDKEEIILLLDGYHRKLAYNKYVKILNGEKVENKLGIIFWKDEILDYEDYFEDLLIKSTQCNMKHGDRIIEKDLRNICVRIVNNRGLDDLVGLNKELSESFGKPKSTISDYTSKAINKRKASRDDIIYRMYKMGMTQAEIGTIFNLSQSQIGEITGKFETEVSGILKIGINKGKSFEQLSTENQLHPLTPYINHLEKENDEKKIVIFLKQNPRCYDVWKFNGRDKRLGIKVPGNIAGQIIINLLYYYTKQGDLILDPMAGGGSTIDACLIMGRKCIAFDLNSQRNDIIP